MFEEEIDKEEFDDDFDWGPLEDAWVKKVLNRHYRYIGLRRYTAFNPENDQWSMSIHFQFLKFYDKRLFSWKINKPDWWQK